MAVLRRQVAGDHLNELAEMLSCSRRHMRTLLNMMESRGWLTWEAEAGAAENARG